MWSLIQCAPTVLWINLDAVELHGEVDVVAASHAGHPTQAHHLRPLDRVAHVYVDPAQVAIDRLQAIAVVDHDAVAIDAERSRPDDTAIKDCTQKGRGAGSQLEESFAQADSSLRAGPQSPGENRQEDPRPFVSSS
jgi:hypothetical protein